MKRIQQRRARFGCLLLAFVALTAGAAQASGFVIAPPKATATPAPAAAQATSAASGATATALPVVTPIPAQTQAAPAAEEWLPLHFQYGKTSGTGAVVKLRKEPSTSAQALAELEPIGFPVIITAKRTNDEGVQWYGVASGELVGYIRADLLTIIDMMEYMQLSPTVAPQATEAPAQTARSGGGSVKATAKPTATTNAAAVFGSYIGDTAAQRFHWPGCQSLPAAISQMGFSTREEAIAYGYAPCEKCNP